MPAVIGVFHANVQHVGANSRNYRVRRMEFLWVRWLGVVPDYAFGRRLARLPKIGFIPDSDEFAFGFLDPSLFCEDAISFLRSKMEEQPG